jgi:putative ATP-binding cassette transporter
LGAFYEATEPPPQTEKAPIEIIEDDSRLAYESLTLITPDDGRLLIADLSLDIPSGKRLLILDPDGSRRAALIRATAGLWKAGHGRIIRPPLKKILFLPQQPYLTLGSLRDQLLYITRPGTPVSEDRLYSVLQKVQLNSVLERVGGLDTEQRDWAGILSLSEQQSLAFARLLLVVPEFAFIDDAVSALSTERVRNLYELLSETAINYITIGSGHELLEYHDRILQLHGDGTWTAMEAIDAPEAEWHVDPAPVLNPLRVG